MCSAHEHAHETRPTKNRRKATGSQRPIHTLPEVRAQASVGPSTAPPSVGPSNNPTTLGLSNTPTGSHISQQERLACSHAHPDLAEAVLGTTCWARPLPLGKWARGDTAHASDLARRKPRVSLGSWPSAHESIGQLPALSICEYLVVVVTMAIDISGLLELPPYTGRC